MYISNIFVTALAATSTAQAFDIRDEIHNAGVVSKRTFGNIFGMLSGLLGGNKQSAQCPAVWTQISAQLTEQFLADGQCTDAARAAIRSSFHDCFNGACDGSLILADECSNVENRGLERLCGNLKTVQANTGVGMADLIQFAAAHGVKTCPGGPTVPVKVGRKDSSQANALGVLPSGRAQSGDLIKLFGMSATFNTTVPMLTRPSIQRLLTRRPGRPPRRPHHRKAALHIPRLPTRTRLYRRTMGQQILLRDTKRQGTIHAALRQKRSTEPAHHDPIQYLCAEQGRMGRCVRQRHAEDEHAGCEQQGPD